MSALRLFVLLAAVLLTACASSRTLSGSFSDIRAETQLKGILFADRSYDYSDIDTTFYDGRLMLTGTMRSEEGRRKLVENAWKADGVKQVIDEILIAEKTSFGEGLTDTRIDQAIRTKLVMADHLSSSNYKMSVSQGVVYLLGVARDEEELQKALEIARSTSGVRSVISHVVYQSAAAQ
jgi:osmotically-inducible protein OsmY